MKIFGERPRLSRQGRQQRRQLLPDKDIGPPNDARWDPCLPHLHGAVSRGWDRLSRSRRRRDFRELVWLISDKVSKGIQSAAARSVSPPESRTPNVEETVTNHRVQPIGTPGSEPTRPPAWTFCYPNLGGVETPCFLSIGTLLPPTVDALDRDHARRACLPAPAHRRRVARLTTAKHATRRACGRAARSGHAPVPEPTPCPTLRAKS